MIKTEVHEVTPSELTNALAKEVVRLLKDVDLPKPLEKPVRVKDIVKHFSCTKQTVWNWIKAGAIPHHKMNGTNFFYMSEVVAYHLENPKPSVEIDVELAEKYAPNYQK